MVNFCYFSFIFLKVPYTSFDRATSGKIWPVIHEWYRSSERYEVVNSYGLFRRFLFFYCLKGICRPVLIEEVVVIVGIGTYNTGEDVFK